MTQPSRRTPEKPSVGPLIKDNEVLQGPFPTFQEYYGSRPLITRVVMPFTKWTRIREVMSLMESKDHHLDIGCGDGALVRQSKCRYAVGIDSLYGCPFTSRLDFPDHSFDYVTMLAVIEHLDDPPASLAEIHRVLKPGGKLIFTTPKRVAEGLIQVYSGSDVREEHQHYFDRETVETLTQGLYHISLYKTFLLGLNQVFRLNRIP